MRVFPTIALTFDDGPVEPCTGEVLDVLSTHGVKATFFVIGRNAERHPQTLQRLVGEGHAMGNHTQDHRRRRAFFPRQMADDILRCQETVRRITGMTPVLFRPPHGMAFGIGGFLARNGLLRVGWSVSSQDWRLDSPGEISKRVIKRTRPGAIVLLHDGAPPGKPCRVGATAQALVDIIEGLRQRGYGFATVPELMRTE
ncbi:MAG: polysaccharide deacetylase family protein [Chloroflexi bacterium]|nr:polysaccharide deacetylase family protein [Chloroflexota bacterium]